MKRKLNKILSLIMAMIMIFGTLPVVSLAVDTEEVVTVSDSNCVSLVFNYLSYDVGNVYYGDMKIINTDPMRGCMVLRGSMCTPGNVVQLPDIKNPPEGYAGAWYLATSMATGANVGATYACGSMFQIPETAANGEYIVFTAVVTHIIHSYTSEVTKPATCTQTGVMTYTCSVCGDNYTKTLPANGHTKVTDNKVAPTCTETGLTEGKHCSVCGEVLVAQTTLPATGHKEVYYELPISATCTTDGMTAGKMCFKCGEITQEPTVIKAGGHEEVTDNAVAPTCTEVGLTEGKHCSVCNEVLVAQAVVPAIGHKDENGDGKCDKCNMIISSSVDTPTQDPECDCMCHKSGFAGFIWKIIRSFYKMFGTNKVCDCGAIHY